MKNYREKLTFIGVDLHKATHTAVMVNCWGDKIDEITIKNKPSEFDKLIKWAKKQTGKGKSPVFGLEDVGGYGRSLAMYLVEKEQVVKDVNASLAYDRRKSNPMMHKNDSWDAQCIADVLISKFNDLPNANPKDIYFTISQMVNCRENIVKEQTAILNQLHGQLSYNYPSYKKFFSDIDGKGALAFWEHYPSPRALEGVSEDEVDAVLRESARSLRKDKARKILDMVAVDGDTTREFQEYFDVMIQGYVRSLRFKKQEIETIDNSIANLMSKLDYQLETMPGIGNVLAAQLVAEIGDIRRFESAHKLAKYAGIAPVNFSSGGKGKDSKCKSGNRNLHKTFYNLAKQQVQVQNGGKVKRNDIFLAYYERKVAEGKTTSQALVCIMRRLVNIVYGMMKNKTAYME